jgi:hypothetical protein
MNDTASQEFTVEMTAYRPVAYTISNIRPTYTIHDILNGLRQDRYLTCHEECVIYEWVGNERVILATITAAPRLTDDGDEWSLVEEQP